MGWTNVASSVLTANTVIVVAGTPNAGIFVYSPVPAAGNLITSITATAGTDPYGNIYLAGTTSYSSTRYTRLFSGGLFLGPVSGGVPDTVNFGGLLEDDPSHMELIGISTGTGTTINPPIIRFIAGDDAKPTGTGSTPRLLLSDGFGTSAADFKITGSMIHADLGETSETWHTPTLGANWAAGPAGGTVQAVQYRRDVQDNVVIVGAVHSTSAAPAATIFTLAAGWRPAITQRVAGIVNNAGAMSAVTMEINSSGAVSITPNLAVSGADTYLTATVPLGTLP